MFPYVSDGDSLPSAMGMETTMVAVANGANASSTSTQSWDKTNTVAAPTPAKPSTSSDKPASASQAPAAFVLLSDRAKAIIEKAKADEAATEGLTDTFDEILTKRTDALADRLSKAFGAMNIPPEYATHMKVDKFGNVTAEGPWKAKIEKMFSDDPALAKELKEVSGLNALKAAQASLDLLTEQKKSTNSEAKQAEAWKNYNIRSINIQTLSGVMTMKDGKLRSAAADYMDMIADPTGLNSVTSRQDFANRLA
jgi:hypothetical protein